MKSIEIDGRVYLLSGKITDPGIIAVTKYIQCFSLDTQTAYTEELASAALRVIKKAFPDIEIATTDELEDLGFEATGQIVNAILDAYKERKANKESSATMPKIETEDKEIELLKSHLKSQLKELEK